MPDETITPPNIENCEVHWLSATLTKSDKQCPNCHRPLCRGVCFYYDTVGGEQIAPPFIGYLCDECGAVNEAGESLTK